MSGQEWVPDPADLRGDDRPLSPAVGPEPGNAPPPFPPPQPPPHFIGRPDDEADPGDEPDADVGGEPEPEVRPRRAGFRFSMPRFRARRDDRDEAEEGVVEVMAGPDADADDPDPDDPGDDEAPAARRRFGLPFRLPRFRRGAAAEAELEPANDDAAPPDDAEYDPADEADADESPSRSGLLAGIALSREARVGMAAGVSFLILVAIWVNNKGRAPAKADKNPPILKLEGPQPGAEPKADGKSPEKPAGKPGEKPAGPEVATTKPAAPAPVPPSAPTPISDPDQGFSAGATGSPAAATGGLAQHSDPGLPAGAPVPLESSPPAPNKPIETPAAAPTAANEVMPGLPAAGEAPASVAAATPPAASPSPAVELPAGTLAQAPAEPAATPAPNFEPATPAPAPGAVAEVKPPEPAPGLPAATAPTLGAAEPAPPGLPPAKPPMPVAPVETAPPIETPAPALASTPAPATPAEPAAPARTPPFEPVPAAAESAAPAASEDGVITIRARARRSVVSTPRSAGEFAAGEAGGLAGFGAMAGAATRKVADGPPPVDDVAGRSQFEPKLHEVRSGENFWTISKRYYGSGRYYQALWAANAREVPVIEDLWVGAVIRIPPPETLDPKLVQPAPPASARPRVADKTFASDVSRTSNDPEAGDPRSERIAATPSRPRRRGSREVEAPDEPPARPTYRVRANETLRSIARDTLGDSRREGEILQLNRPQLRSASDLTAGMTIALPSDANAGRRPR